MYKRENFFDIMVAPLASSACKVAALLVSLCVLTSPLACRGGVIPTTSSTVNAVGGLTSTGTASSSWCGEGMSPSCLPQTADTVSLLSADSAIQECQEIRDLSQGYTREQNQIVEPSIRQLVVEYFGSLIVDQEDGAAPGHTGIPSVRHLSHRIALLRRLLQMSGQSELEQLLTIKLGSLLCRLQNLCVGVRPDEVTADESSLSVFIHPIPLTIVVSELQGWTSLIEAELTQS